MNATPPVIRAAAVHDEAIERIASGSKQTAALTLAQLYRRTADVPANVLEATGLLMAAELAEAYADGLAPAFPTSQQSASYSDGAA